MKKEMAKQLITAYDCMLLILSKLSEKGRMWLPIDDVVPTLYQFKDNEATKILFEDISFENKTETITSDDIDKSIEKLKAFGIINIEGSLIIISIGFNQAEGFLSAFYPEYRNAADIVCEGFPDKSVDYEGNIMNLSLREEIQDIEMELIEAKEH